jgi:type I restriction enzyme M protein
VRQRLDSTDGERVMALAWEAFDLLRFSDGRGNTIDSISTLAALLVLRWVAFIEAEREAVAAFDDGVFEPILPDRLRQNAWDGQLSADRITAELSSIRPRHGVSQAKYVTAVVPILQRSAKSAPAVFDKLLTAVESIAFDTTGARAQAAAAFDELLATAIENQGREGGEFTTPRHVAELMVRLVEPRPGDRVYDPCFGVGGLLVEAARRMCRAVSTEEPRRWSDVRSNGIFGVEINQASYVIGLCRVLLAGIDEPGLEHGDALERPLPRNRAVEGFDCILASPPWGGKATDARARQYPVPTANVENLFLQHVMASLRPGGRAVLALPEATLFRTGADRHVRKMLLEEFRVEGVISLPAGAFAPCTSIPSSLVVFRRDTPRSEVRFVQISAKSWKAVANDTLEDGGEPSGIGGRLLPSVTEIIRHESDLPSDDVEAAVGMWSVPVKTLAARDFELLAKRTGAEALDITLERLAAASAELKLASLDQVAKVFQGVSYDRKMTTERRDREATIPLIRVADIAEPNVRAPALFFTPGAETRVHAELRLQPGDILITTSGTVGKIGIVEDGREVVGAVAAKSLAVIRSIDGMTPAFLAALLRSPSYREWFTGHARGATIQHLSVRTVRRLQVPVPPIPMQDAVLRNLGAGGDALALLLRLASGSTADPIAAWLERPSIVAALAEKDAPADPAKALAAVSSELQHLRPLRNRAAHGQAHDIQPGLLNWLLASMEVGAVLDGIDAVPEGAPRLAALELAKARLLAASRGLREEGSPLAQRLQTFVSSVDRLVDRAAQPMLGPVEIRLRPAPNEVPFGVPTEVQLQLENASSIALRRLDVRTTPEVGSGAIGYLAEGATATIPLTVQALDTADTFKVAVRWTGVRLDGGQVRGERTIELLVKSTRDEVLAGDLGPSPYIVGNPVDREEMFFGRYDVLDRIQRQLGSATNANVILLEGNRRTGKTSILRQLQKPEALPGWIAVYCSFQDAEGDESRAGISTRNVYRLMARTIGWSLFDAGVRTWFPGEPAAESKRPFKVEFRQALDRAFNNEHPFEVFEEYLTSALAAVRPRRLLLMLDEFDKLQEGIDAGVTSPQVPENIRHILQHHQALSAILTGSRRLKRLREEYWSALFGLGYRLGISALPLDDARRLVTEPVSERLRYLPTARDRVVEICAAQPFLIQSICNRIFERAAESGERTITIEAVDQAAGEMVRDNEHFRTLWDYAHTHRRRFLLALCERLAGEPDAVTLALLVTKLEEHGVRGSRDSAVGNDLDYLRELELVEFDKSYRGGTYRIAVPLLGLWIRTSIDFDDAVARAREEAEEAQG